MSIKQITKISTFTALIIIFTVIIPPITVPVITVSITLQTLVVMLAGVILSPKEAFISMLLYLIIGAIGIPVFSGMTGGLGILFGPTGGFLLSFPLAAWLISLFKRFHSSYLGMFIINVLFGIGVVYLIGIMGLVLYTKGNILEITFGMLIFIPFDLVKAVIATSLKFKMDNLGI